MKIRQILLSSTLLLFMCVGVTYAENGKLNGERTNNNDINKESIDSFYNAVDDLSWANSTEDNSIFLKSKGTCKADLVQKIKKFQTKKFKRNDAYNKAIQGVNELADMVQRATEEFEFKSAYKNQYKFLENWKRFKIYDALGKGGEEADFLERFESDSNNAKLTEAEKNGLKAILRKYLSIKSSGNIYYENHRIDNCIIDARGAMTIDNISETQIKWKLEIYMTEFDCDCIKADNPLELERTMIMLTADITSTVRNNDFRNIIFDSPTGLAYHIILFACCNGKLWYHFYEKNKANAPNDSNQNGQPEEEEEESHDDKDDEEDKNDEDASDTKDEDCCTTEPPTQTIGFLPGIALTDNFENLSYDLGLEYMRYITDTFGDNQLYAGAIVGYMGVEEQDGNIKENMFYGAGIVENRTPISDCGDVQWVNRFCAQYGQGTIETFGNKDDFTTFTFGIHTGINVQLNDKVAVGADVGVLDFGSVTFKPENGPEIKQDVGDLRLNKGNRVRFGIRLTF